jgi:hypothetical protein
MAVTSKDQMEDQRRKQQRDETQTALERQRADHRGEVRLHQERLLGLAKQHREQLHRAQEEEARVATKDAHRHQDEEGQLQREIEELRETLEGRATIGATRIAFAARREERRRAFTNELTARAEVARRREETRYAEAERQGAARLASTAQGLAAMGQGSTAQLVRQHEETLAQARRHWAAAVAPRDAGVQLLVEQRDRLFQAVAEADAGVVRARERGQVRREELAARRKGLEEMRRWVGHKNVEHEHLQRLQGACLLLEERLRRLRKQVGSSTRALGVAQEDASGRERKVEAWTAELERHCDTTARQLQEQKGQVQQHLRDLQRDQLQGFAHAPPHT